MRALGLVLTLVCARLAGVLGQGCCTSCVNSCMGAIRLMEQCTTIICASMCSTTACTSAQFRDATQKCVCTNCPIGKYSPSFTPDGACRDCPTGTYMPLTGRNFCASCLAGTVAPSTGSSSCAVCAPGTYQPNEGRSACLPCPTGTYRNDILDPSTCNGCVPGNYQPSVGQRACLLCPPGTYQPNGFAVSCPPCPTNTFQDYMGGTVCTTCSADKICPPGFVPFTCAAYADAQCEQCSSPYTNRGGADNNNCDSCEAGYYSKGGVGVYAMCIPCTWADVVCRPGQFVSCPAYSTSWCANCTGLGLGGQSFCGIHQQPNNYCTSGTDRVAATCVACPAGTEKPSSLVRDCVACGTGYFKAVASALACTACTNKYPTGSVYVSWNISTATTSACPWACNAGYYRSGETCLPCSGIAGKFSASQGQSLCLQCTNAPRNSTYAVASSVFDGRTNSCPWICNSGYGVQGSSCIPCQSGTYSGTTLANGMTIRVCMSCSVCIPGGTYEHDPCMATSDRVCFPCIYQCSAGSYIKSACNTTTPIQCAQCATVCRRDTYLSGATCSGQTTSDTVLSRCLGCVGAETCLVGATYLSSNCSGTETSSNQCDFCGDGGCSSDMFSGGCVGFQNTQCTAYTMCARGWYLSGKQKDRDGVCQSCRDCSLEGLPTVLNCSRYDNTICGGMVCNKTRPCAQTVDASFYCDYAENKLAPVCGICPNGYGSDGQFCLECPRGQTCSRRGDIVCAGQCARGRVSVCGDGFASGYVTCDGPCAVPSDPSFVVSRAGHERPVDGDCRTYIECNPGYYKRFRTNGQVQCEVCNDLLKPASLGKWATAGLSVNDATSCLWECRSDISAPNANRSACILVGGRSVIPDNAAGWYGKKGSGAYQTCGQGRGLTSEAGTALVGGECLVCPAYPAGLASWTGNGIECEWYCQTGVARGEACVVVQSDCRARGYTLVNGLTCTRSALPWNHAGTSKAGVGVVIAGGGVANGSNTNYLRTSSLAYGVTGRHTVTAGGRNWTVDGGICSMISTWIGGREFMFGAVCNTSFLAYLNLSDPKARLGVLIGNPGARGWRDGFRTEALFESELYVASGTDNRTLFVLDRWNCLLREVSIADTPGTYLTRSYTVYGLTDKFALFALARCYGAGSLASPRSFWALSRERVLFSDDNGLWQLELATREVVSAMSETVEQFEADDLVDVRAPDIFSLVLVFGKGVAWTVRAVETACPDDYTSFDGGGCSTPCVWKSNTGGLGQYLSAGQCVGCIEKACGVGRFWSPCTRVEQGQCMNCTSLSDGKMYAVPDDCRPDKRKYVPPCPAGYYRSGAWCEQCPKYSATVRTGALYSQQCKCVAGFVRRDGMCVTDSPLYVFESACASNCTVPGNASLVTIKDASGNACAWQCNAGFFGDSTGAWMNKCKPCLALGLPGQTAVTRGDDGTPSSCEFV